MRLDRVMIDTRCYSNHVIEMGKQGEVEGGEGNISSKSCCTSFVQSCNSILAE